MQNFIQQGVLLARHLQGWSKEQFSKSYVKPKSFRWKAAGGVGVVSSAMFGIFTSKLRLTTQGIRAFSNESKKNSLWEFSAVDIDGNTVSLSKYKDNVALVVNVASKCGYTNKNYSQLQSLHEKYSPQGFVVLAFPCNQFRGQEPGTNQQIKEFATTKYKASFPMFSKIEVNGPNAHPIYVWLKENAPGSTADKDIPWNFEKFLVNREGVVVSRHNFKIQPFELENEIKKLLEK